MWSICDLLYPLHNKVVGGVYWYIVRSTAHTVLDGLFPYLAQMITSMRRTLTYFVTCNDLSPRPISSRLNNCDLAYIMDYIYVTQVQPKRGRCVMYHVQVKKSKCQGHPGCFAVLVDHWSTVSSFVLVLVELAIGRTCRQPSFPRWGWVPGEMFLTFLWPQSGRATPSWAVISTISPLF